MIFHYEDASSAKFLQTSNMLTLIVLLYSFTLPSIKHIQLPLLHRMIGLIKKLELVDLTACFSKTTLSTRPERRKNF
jgi:hypothetical protein